MIGKYYNGTKKVIAATESINVCLNSVEASFQMIIDTCEFDDSTIYRVDKASFTVKIAFFDLSYIPIGLKLRFQAQTC